MLPNVQQPTFSRKASDCGIYQPLWCDVKGPAGCQPAPEYSEPHWSTCKSWNWLDISSLGVALNRSKNIDINIGKSERYQVHR